MQPYRYRCGGINTVDPSDLSYLTHEQMFWKETTLEY